MCITAREALGWWTTDPVALAVVGAPSIVFALGTRRLWRTRGRGHGIRTWEAAAFAASQVVLAVALLSPVDRLSDFLFSAHMTQHELVMIVAPPLAVLGRPWVAALFALPDHARRAAGAWMRRPRVTRTFRAVSGPVVALVVHALVVWLWHLPSWFEAALASEPVHAVQHATFYVSAALFWWAILRGRYGRVGYGLATIFVFATAMHTSILGLLFTVMDRVVYPTYAARGAALEIDAQGDQVLAGLVMWIPAGTALTLGRARLVRRVARRGFGARRARGAAEAHVRSACGIVALSLFLAACDDDTRSAARMTGGDPARGREVIRAAGCGTCHVVPGVPGATALVGPPLDHLARRGYLAGMLPNTPENLVRWIAHPQEVKPGNAMPDVGLGEGEARDAAAYLYTLK